MSEEKAMNDSELQGLRKVELEILKQIDSFCGKNKIKYSLYAGTLIGAVRHKGFIPWDDDIDIVMTRSQYTKFYDAWMRNPIDGYYLESYENDMNTQNAHTKIRKNGTILLSDIEDEKKGHHGIWVDIFIMDKVSEDEQGKKLLKNGRKMLLMVKANGRMSGESKKKKVARNLLKVAYPYFFRKRKLCEIAEFIRENDRKVTKYSHRCDMCTISYLDVKFPAETGQQYTKVIFEGEEFPAFANYDEILKIMYGDYMKFPPVEERVCTHKPKKIVF